MFFPDNVVKEIVVDEKVKVNKIDIFTFLKSITVNKKDLSTEPSFNKDYSPYMINKWLSMSNDLYAVTIAMYLSTMEMSKEAHYKFLLNDMSKKYIKFSYKGKKNEYNKEIVNLLKIYYNISEKKVKEILSLDLLTKDQIEIIEKSYGGDMNGKRS